MLIARASILDKIHMDSNWQMKGISAISHEIEHQKCRSKLATKLKV
jgi:hypothetical protein